MNRLCICAPLLIPYCNLHELVLSCTSSYDAERRLILRRNLLPTPHTRKGIRTTRKTHKKRGDKVGAPRAPEEHQVRSLPEKVNRSAK